MLNWGPVLVSVVLFVLLTPGLLFQVPGRSRCVEFANLVPDFFRTGRGEYRLQRMKIGTGEAQPFGLGLLLDPGP
ncbi:hypothetical protein Ahy_A04g021530 [Arachis hypogaea]|uniref:Uncharacterized protein n=1 Tax=Arachis hypogaea TaxID=3818 RepID=A0A445DKM6_ARAHY|nr:hypothetical protein Ahy_A04g021530 [Arachis hypogaea]